MGSCDNRCTSGQEGTCRCSCGGINHGAAKATYDAIRGGGQATIKGAGIDLVLSRGEGGEIAAKDKHGNDVGGYESQEEFVKNLGELIRAGRVEVMAKDADNKTKVLVQPKLTDKEAQRQIREMGATVSRKDGEYRVNVPWGTEDTAYYTDDPRDAVGTARAMMEQTSRLEKISDNNYNLKGTPSKTQPISVGRTLNINSHQAYRNQVSEVSGEYKYRTDIYGPDGTYMGFHLSKKKPNIKVQ